MIDPVIRVSNLKKRYGSTVAVADVSLVVNQGEIFGLIGPNGAGKTTTMECVEGLRKWDAGSVSVLGLDPHKEYQVGPRPVPLARENSEPIDTVLS